LVLTKKAGTMQLFLHDLDDLHQLDFVHNRQLVKEIERLGGDWPRSSSSGRAGRCVP
jgi:hypothetical protein